MGRGRGKLDCLDMGPRLWGLSPHIPLALRPHPCPHDLRRDKRTVKLEGNFRKARSVS